MENKQKERWVELAERAANEQDSVKLMALVTELNEVLAHKPQRVDNTIAQPKAADGKS